MAKQRKASEMGRVLARRGRRGLTWDELSEETGIPKSTLSWWHRRLRDRGSERSRRSEFVEVTVVPSPSASAPVVEVIVQNGRRVSVPPGFDVEHLRQVITALES